MTLYSMQNVQEELPLEFYFYASIYESPELETCFFIKPVEKTFCLFGTDAQNI